MYGIRVDSYFLIRKVEWVRNVKQFDDEEIAALGKIIKSDSEGAKEARNKLVEMFVSEAERICIKYSHDDECVDIAYEVLMYAAVQYWKQERNVKFSTYLVYKIREKLFEERCKELNISKHTYKDIKKLLKAEAKYEQETGQAPTDKVLSEILKMSEEYIRKLRVYLNQTKETGDDVDENDSINQIEDKKSTDGYLNVENEELFFELQEVLSQFDEIDRDIFLLGSELKMKSAFKWTELKTKLGLDLTTDAIRNRYFKVRNELKRYYKSSGVEAKTTTQMKDNIVTDVKGATFADYVECVLVEASKAQPGTDDDRRKWIQNKKEIVNSYIGGRKEYHKAKHLEQYANYKNRKYILLVFAFVLELSIDDVELLLKNAGLSFSPYVEGDYEVIDYIVDGKYDIEILRKYKR